MSAGRLAGKLIAKAWRDRAEAVRSPATDEAALGDAMAWVEADLSGACEVCEREDGHPWMNEFGGDLRKP